MRVADRVDPLARVPGLVEPVRVGRLDLDHSLDGPDGERRGAGGEELPQVPLRLRHLNEARLEDGHADVGREAPVAETHHPGAHAGGHLVPVAHVGLGGGVRPAVLDQVAHRDPVADQRDVEDGKPDDREPEGALGKPLARERAANDPRQRQPAEPCGEQCAAADNRHVRVREVAHQVARVAGAGEVLRDPGQVLEHRVDAPEDQEEAAGEEVLRRLGVVRVQLVVRVGRLADRRRAARHELGDRGDHDREEGDVGQELQRREMLDPHTAAPSGGRVPGSRR